MTTAREQAQEAALQHTRLNDPRMAADAASDIWEPIVIDLLNALEEGWGGVTRDNLVSRTREALGI